MGDRERIEGRAADPRRATPGPLVTAGLAFGAFPSAPNPPLGRSSSPAGDFSSGRTTQTPGATRPRGWGEPAPPAGGIAPGPGSGAAPRLSSASDSFSEPIFLTGAERARLDELAAESEARSAGLHPGSYAAHLEALGDPARALELARAAEPEAMSAAEETYLARAAWDLRHASPLGRVASYVTPPQHLPTYRGVSQGSAPAWKPLAPAADRPLRRRLWRIRRSLQPLSRPRVRACGWAAVDTSGVGVIVNGEGRAKFGGVAHCGSVWECPCCAATIKAKRAAEVTHVCDSHGVDRVAMLTLTIRHGKQHSLRAARAGLANAWRKTTSGEAWRRFLARMGIEGMVRALEVTHGPNGWHPHLHVLVLLKRAPSADQLGPDGTWQPEALGWLIERWQEKVCDVLGSPFVPNNERAALLSVGSSSAYVAKLGLEVTDAALSKRGPNRSPLEIADDWARHRRRRDGQLWREWCSAMFGARQLTWTRGLKKRYGLTNRTDAELIEDDETPAGEDRLVATLTRPEWAELRGSDVDGQPAPIWLLRQVEIAGAAAVPKALERLRLLKMINNNSRVRAAPARDG